MFPGIASAPIEFCADGETPDGRSWREHFEKGTLLVGVGGGFFDEHATKSGQGQRVGESSCSLVIKHLGLQDHPIYKKLSELVTKVDQGPCTEPFHLAALMKCLYRSQPKNWHKTFETAMEMIRAYLHEEIDGFKCQIWIQQAIKGGQTRAVEIQTAGGGKKYVRVIWAAGCDSYKFSAMTRSHNFGFGVCIQRRTNGQTMISTNRQLQHLMDFQAVVEAVRRAEFFAEGGTEEDLKGENLRRPGKIHPVPNWYYQMPGDNLLNGSESAPEILGSKILMADLVKLVCQHIGKKLPANAVKPQSPAASATPAKPAAEPVPAAAPVA